MATQELAVGKRIRISKMQQHILLIVLVTSLVFGVSLVLSIYFIKYIVFNTKIIAAKDEAIIGYEKTITNVGICKPPASKSGRYTDKELENCNPDDIKVEELPDTLRYNVMVTTAQNEDLETVGRDSLADCFGENGKKLNYTRLYQNAKTTKDKMYFMYLTRMCSALRVIPDALPAFQNEEALMASLNQIFILSDLEPDNLSPNGTASRSKIKGLGAMPVSVVVEADTDKTMELLNNIEKSIRFFEIRSATIGWTGVDKLELRAQASAYYTSEVKATEQTETIYATDKAKEKAKGERE